MNKSSLFLITSIAHQHFYNIAYCNKDKFFVHIGEKALSSNSKYLGFKYFCKSTLSNSDNIDVGLYITPLMFIKYKKEILSFLKKINKEIILFFDTSRIKKSNYEDFKDLFFIKLHSIFLNLDNPHYTIKLFQENIKKFNLMIFDIGINKVIDDNFKKNPFWKKLITQSFLSSSMFSFLYYENTIPKISKNIMENKHLIKNITPLLFSSLDKNFHSLEFIDDFIEKHIKYLKIKNNIKKIMGNKFNSLISQDSYDLYIKIYNYFDDIEKTNKFLNIKPSAYKNSDTFFYFMKDKIKELTEFKQNDLIQKLNSLNIKYLKNGDLLLFEVNSYEHLKELGSSDWCIHRNEFYFNKYTSKKNRQFLCYDFSFDFYRKEYIIGITCNYNLDIVCSYYKDNTVCEKNYLKKFDNFYINYFY